MSLFTYLGERRGQRPFVFNDNLSVVLLIGTLSFLESCGKLRTIAYYVLSGLCSFQLIIKMSYMD